MSVYVKDMDMPESCEQCPFLFVNELVGENVCVLCARLSEDCPLVPAADVVEVVRCEDCKHCLKEDEYELWCYGRGFPARLVRADDYCSYGADTRGGDNDGNSI